MKIFFRKAVRTFFFLLLFLLSGIIVIDLFDVIVKWLKVDKPISSNALVCEGWLSSNYYDSVVSVFHENNYNTLLITGSKLPDGVLLSQNGKIILKNFSFTPSLSDLDKKYIRIHLNGSKSAGEYAKCIIFKNNSPISDTIVVTKKTHLFYNEALKQNDSLVIQFINDKYTKYSDRNIVLKSCYIGDYTVNIHSSEVWLNYQDVYTDTDAKTYSENTAKHLIRKGIPENKIFSLSSLSSGISKTYNTASDATQWLKSKNIKSANIITIDYHSRRTLYSYKKAAPEYPVGIIPLTNKSYHEWFGAKIRILKEISGSIFIKVIPRKVLENK
jgi:uncharacterized SAM-binding protein YcdF (DUF218 family)